MPQSLTRFSQHRFFVPGVIVAFFLLFLAVAFKGRGWWVVGDALVYSYPLRSLAWQMIKHGEAPIWTPLLLSGYPLLSMAQVAVGYPLTWFYAVLPGYAAEMIYVCAPYFLAPLFLYAYLRECHHSRLASLLGALSFGCGGFMIGPLSHTGMFTNAVMWLPLFLLQLERACHAHFWRPLCWATAAYTLAVLTGLGQGFLYSGIIALAYGLWLAMSQDAPTTKARWRPLVVAICAIVFSAGLSAWQILETWQAQQRSQRADLSYAIFSGGAFTWREILHGFLSPLYFTNTEMVPTVALLTGIFALVALLAIVRAPRQHWRGMFWFLVALSGFLLMQGDGTPLYRLLYHLPVVNKFRIPWRHAYEWTLGLSVLAACGWDYAESCWERIRPQFTASASHQIIGVCASLIALLIGFFTWWQAASFPAQQNILVSLPFSTWLVWKVAFSLALLFALGWVAWRMVASARKAWLLVIVLAATFWEASIYFTHATVQHVYATAAFQRTEAATRFLQQASPTAERVYTSAIPFFGVIPPSFALANLSANAGLANAAGYEPLMPERYGRAFGLSFHFGTPDFSAPPDPQVLQPSWQVLDLLNVRYLASYDIAAIMPPRRQGNALFAFSDNRMELAAGQSVKLGGTSKAVDQLSLITSLGNAADLPQGAIVGQINVRTVDGQVASFELKAGEDTAETAFEHPRVSEVMKHQAARIFDSQANEMNQVHRFWTSFTLPRASAVNEVTITNKTAHASLSLFNVTLANVKAQSALLLKPALPSQWRLAYEEPQVQIYENSQALPRVWLTPQAEAVASVNARQRIRGESGQSFNPRQTALLESGSEALPAELTNGANSLATAEARVTSYAPSRMAIETNADRAAVLVVSERYYPGWQALLDGQETKIYQADYLLRGIVLPAGKHKVEMRYTAPNARLGLLIAFISLVGLLSLGWFKKS